VTKAVLNAIKIIVTDFLYNKIFINYNLLRPAKTLPPRGAGWEPGRLAFQS